MTSENCDPINLIRDVVNGCNRNIAITVSLMVAQSAPDRVMAEVCEKLSDSLHKLQLHYKNQAKTYRINDLVSSLNRTKLGYAGQR